MVLLVAVGACSGPGPWQKSGASPGEISIDLASCRQEAKAGSNRTHVVDFPYPYPLGWNGGRQVSYLEWQQRVETLKSYEETRLTAGCMRDKGYRDAR